jgi:FkbM family methyltransferase
MKLQFPDGFDYVKSEFERTGVWEPRTTDYIKSHLKKNQTFIDVGANVGYFTILAAELGAKVHAFEPSTKNRELLIKNIEDNKCTNVSIMDCALSNFDGLSSLFNGKTAGENSLNKNYHNGEGEEQVIVRKWDSLDIPIPDMVKIDVEGHEREVLEGMQSILTTKKPITIILEDWSGDVSDWLIKEHGFNLVTTDRGSGNKIFTKNQKFKYEEEPIRCHLLGTFNAPNTLKDEGIGNAFGTKVINMAKILRKLGHYIIFYGIEGSDVDCDEFVQVSTMEVLREAYGEWDNTKIYKEKYGDIPHQTFNNNAIAEINKRKKSGDFLLICHGTFHKPIADAVNITNTVEIGIGHRSSFARFRIFESEFQRAWTYGREDNDLNPNPIPGFRNKGDGSFYDCVIPGFFDPNDFTYSDRKDDYFLYLGRVISKKGIFVAQQVCEKLNKKLVVAGFGYTKDDNPVDAKAFEDIIKMPNVEYVGFAGKDKRRELMSKAKALFLPTLYLEPFGYVVLEANLSGTPVISTDFGAFPETIKHGYNGYRCRTFKEFVDAVKNIDKLKPSDCRKWGMKYTLDETAPLYKRYFDSILDLGTSKGWYKL